MWPLQPTQGIPDRLAAALAALVVTGAVLTLILMLTMGGRHEAKRAVTLPVVYWSGPPPEAPDETPPEEVPVTAETVPEVSAPPKPVTLAFESPAIAAAGLPMPKYEIGRPYQNGRIANSALRVVQPSASNVCHATYSRH